MITIPDTIASELDLRPAQVLAALELLKDGATVPFIARYRKERTGNLDEVQLRQIEERHQYLTELEDRKRVVLEAIAAQDKLTPTCGLLSSPVNKKRNWKTCICPTVPNAAPAPRLPKKRAWNPWPSASKPLTRAVNGRIC
jgi:uncharacterized protein